MSTIEGGMICTNDKKIYHLAKILRSHGMSRELGDKNLENKIAKIEMTLTTPNCPVAESLLKLVKDNIMNVDGVTDVDLKLVWDPPWSKDRMSEAAKLELNL